MCGKNIERYSAFLFWVFLSPDVIIHFQGWGDPHYTTWDGKSFNFQIQGTFYLVCLQSGCDLLIYSHLVVIDHLHDLCISDNASFAK